MNDPLSNDPPPEFSSEQARPADDDMTPNNPSDWECLQCDADFRDELEMLDRDCRTLMEQVPPVVPNPQIRASLLARIEADDTSHSTRNEARSAPIIVRGETGDWLETGVPGVTLKVLHQDREQHRLTAMIRFEPGATYPSHPHAQDEECLVLEGDLDFGDYVLHPGDFLRLPAGTIHGIARSQYGCLCLITMAIPDFLVA